MLGGSRNTCRGQNEVIIRPGAECTPAGHRDIYCYLVKLGHCDQNSSCLLSVCVCVCIEWCVPGLGWYGFLSLRQSAV